MTLETLKAIEQVIGYLNGQMFLAQSQDRMRDYYQYQNALSDVMYPIYMSTRTNFIFPLDNTTRVK